MTEAFHDVLIEPGQPRLIGEPMTRSDGVTLSMYVVSTGVEKHTGDTIVPYTHSQVRILGEGSWTVGFARIAQEGSECPDPYSVWGPAVNPPLPFSGEMGPQTSR